VIKNRYSHLIILEQVSVSGTQLGNKVFATAVTGLQVEELRVGIPLREVGDTGALAN